jgi:hypothetical protein
VRQGRTWSRNYKSPSSPPSPLFPDRFRIFRLSSYGGPFQSVQPFPDMLKLTNLITPLFSHAETDFIDHISFPAILKLTLLATSLSSHAESNFLTTPLFIHAETDFIDYAPFQPAETDFFDQALLQSCSNNCCFSTLYNPVYLPPNSVPTGLPTFSVLAKKTKKNFSYILTLCIPEKSYSLPLDSQLSRYTS